MFSDEVDKNDPSVIEILNRYAKYCLPIFVEIASRHNKILRREERKKLKNPQIIFPEYTWRKNYNLYKTRASFMFGKISSLPVFVENNKKKIGVEYDAVLWIWMWVFLRIHSKKTEEELSVKSMDFKQSVRRIRKVIRDNAERVYCQSDHYETLAFEEILSHYDLSIDFEYEYELW